MPLPDSIQSEPVKRWLPPKIRDVLSGYGLAILLLITMWVLVLGFSAVQKQRLVDDAQRELTNLNSAVTQHTDSLFRSVEMSLWVLDRWLQANPGIDPLRERRFNELVNDIRSTSAGLIDPRMVSTRGKLHYLPTRDGATLADVGDRPYYREAIKLGPGKLYIGGPVLSRVTGKWGIPVSMRLTKPVGDMEVVFAAIELDRLEAFHDRFRFKPTGTVLLMKRDGVVLSRTPFDANLLGRNLSDQPWFAGTSQASSGFLTTTGALTDGQTRFAAFEQLPAYSLTVAVTRGTEDVLANYYAQRNIILGVVSVVSVLGLLLSAHMRRTQLVSTQLRDTALQRMLTEIFEIGTDIVVLADLQGNFLYCNPVFRRFFGIAPDAPVNTIRAETIASPEWREWRREVLPVVMKQGHWHGETLLKDQEGQEHTFSHNLIAHHAADGTVQYTSGILRDITQQKKIETQLLHSELRLRMITDSVPALIAETDNHYIYQFVNRTYKDWLGLSPGDMVGRSVEQVMGPDIFKLIDPYHIAAF